MIKINYKTCSDGSRDNTTVSIAKTMRFEW